MEQFEAEYLSAVTARDNLERDGPTPKLILDFYNLNKALVEAQTVNSSASLSTATHTQGEAKLMDNIHNLESEIQKKTK